MEKSRQPTPRDVAVARHLLRTVSAITLLLTATACSNSSLVLGPLYERLDNRIISTVSDMTDLSDAQQRKLKSLATDFHEWHRQDQLPDYQALVNDVSETLGNDALDSAQFGNWWQTVEGLINTLQRCHPMTQASGLASSLTPEQIEQAMSGIEKRREKHRERHQNQTQAERAERRIESTADLLKTAGLTLNNTQKKILADAYNQQHSLRQEYFKLSDAWFNDLKRLLDTRKQPEFDARWQSHIARFWTLLESNHSAEWQQNRDLWKQTIYRLLASLTNEQRKFTAVWLGNLVKTINRIGTDEPASLEDNRFRNCDG